MYVSYFSVLCTAKMLLGDEHVYVFANKLFDLTYLIK
jgi:hypothetical protein